MKLNLQTKGKEQEILLKYLEENASEILANKINNGINIVKDGKPFISKKDLTGFMRYATDETKKLAEKGASSAMVEDKVVFGWLMHYFQEDSIEGTLYNPDGTPYVPPKKEYKPTTTSTPVVPKVEKKPEPQLSLFDMLTTNNKQEEKPETSSLSLKGEMAKTSQPDPLFDEDDETSEEDIEEAMEEVAKIEPRQAISPLYQKYLDIQKNYPNSIIAYRLGDFYEVFGDNARLLSDELDLTLTGRDCGFAERIPMVGFPYHCAENYLNKASKKYEIIAVEPDGRTTVYTTINEKPVPQRHWIDDNTYADEDGVTHKISNPSLEVPKFLLDLFDNKIIAR